MKRLYLTAFGALFLMPASAEAQGFGGNGLPGGGPGPNGPDGGGPGFNGGGGRDQPPPRLNRRRGPAGSPIDYFAYAETTPMWTIDAPVTGFGNEALWEDVDPHFATARVARASTARVASR